jgi:hypothetical protein
MVDIFNASTYVSTYISFTVVKRSFKKMSSADRVRGVAAYFVQSVC